jgi:hypothetical protein
MISNEVENLFISIRWLDPDNSSGMIDALDKMVGDYQFSCPTLEFAQR